MLKKVTPFCTAPQLLLCGVQKVLIFTIAFVGSRDLVIAFIITAVFMILSKYIFNENSRFNILPKRLKELETSLDNFFLNFISACLDFTVLNW